MVRRGASHNLTLGHSISDQTTEPVVARDDVAISFRQAENMVCKNMPPVVKNNAIRPTVSFLVDFEVVSSKWNSSRFNLDGPNASFGSFK